MSYEELLAKIDAQFGGIGYSPKTNALRAVVELHKPDELAKGFSVCPICHDNIGPEVYPCPTIQAIEKELQ